MEHSVWLCPTSDLTRALDINVWEQDPEERLNPRSQFPSKGWLRTVASSPFGGGVRSLYSLSRLLPFLSFRSSILEYIRTCKLTEATSELRDKRFEDE